MKFDPDDPRLTAYVLGELDDSDRAEVEALLQESPEARKAVEEIRSTVWVLRDELQKESTPQLAPDQRERVLDRAEGRAIPLRRRWVSNWRVWGLAASVLIVAGLGLFHTGVGNLLSTARFSEQTKESVTWEEFSHELSPRIAYDGTNGTISRGDVTVGPGANPNVRPIGVSKLRDVRSWNDDAESIPSRISIESDRAWSSADEGSTQWTTYWEHYAQAMKERPTSGGSAPGAYLNVDPSAANVPTYLMDVDTATSAGSRGGLENLDLGGNIQVDAIYADNAWDRTAGDCYAGTHPSNAPPVEYDGGDGRASNGDILRVGEGSVRSAISKYSTFQLRTPSLDIRAHNNVDVYGTTGQGWSTATVTIEGQDYSWGLQERDPTAPIPYTSNIPIDPFRSLDNDGDGLTDEIVDANGNTFTVRPVPKPEQLNGNEDYERIYENPFVRVLDNPLSTFSIDVDTASYANVRRFLNEGRLPPADAVRIEEMVNYFTYAYKPPTGKHPFAVHVEVAGCPWNLDHRLVRVGLKGREVPQEDRPPSNLVFLLDVSGSMNPPNKLPLLQKSMKMLVEHLTANDRVAIVVYAGASGLVLPSTSCEDKQPILDALGRLKAGGSTAGSEGIQLAYEIAAKNFIKDGINRVILCTDGDFNVGITDRGQLIRLIEEKAKTGVFLSVLGFGTGNLKDSTMEQLADKGNGNYAYIDSLKEGEKVLVEQMGGTLVTIAKDVKIQIEFNPGQVSAYRLIGYENRMLKKEDFNDDTKDAGEIGAGHTVTALYELIPSDRPYDVDIPDVDPLKYQKRPGLTKAAGSLEILNLKLRYKEPAEDTSKLIEQPVRDSFAEYSQASDDFKFAASVAAFGMVLRGSEHGGNATLEMIEELAGEGKGTDAKGYRAGFLELVRKAKQLTPSR